RIAYSLLLTSLVFEITAFKVLVYNSRYAHSHSKFLGKIADGLVDAGHNVTSLIPIIGSRGNDVTVKSKKILIPQSQETLDISRGLDGIRANFIMADNLNLIEVLKNRNKFASRFRSQCKALLHETQLLQILRKEKFDVMIVENFDMCGVAYSHLLEPRALITSSSSYPYSYMFEDFGIPLALSENPSAFIYHLDVHSMWSRLKNLYANWLTHVNFYPRRAMIEELFRNKFGDGFPSFEEISSHAAYTLVNSEPLIDYATSTINRVIHIGGIAVEEPIALDEKWNAILSQRSKHILISFGSVAKAATFPLEIKQSISTVVGRFPEVTFIWKYEDLHDSFANETLCSLPNLILSPWIPQNDLLNDDRISLFITHAGMGSTQEIAMRGKPGIFVPLHGDQSRNAGMMAFNGLGKVIDKFDLVDPEKLEVVISEVLTNERYTNNAREMRARLAKKPFGARELLIKTVEFAAEFGPSKALRPQSYDMNALQYYNI
ncbi:hypothetical protein PENTCL1PPCAC_934, partial [Pristionchus entomophagus]